MSPDVINAVPDLIAALKRYHRWHTGLSDEVDTDAIAAQAAAALEKAEPDAVRVQAHADIAKRLIDERKIVIPAVVTETNFCGATTRGWFGFHFDTKGTAKVGDLLDNQDGSMARVRMIVPGYKAP